MTIPADMLDEDLANDVEWIDVEDVQPRPEPQPEPDRTGTFRGIVADADLADFVKRPKSGVAREYERKTAAALNAVFKGAVQSPGTVIDAATILVYGDAISSAAGELAAEDEKARGFIDFLTTPSNPWIAAAMVALPCALQLLRNHEQDIEKIRPVDKTFWTMKFGKKRIPLKISLKPKLPRRLKAQTVEPVALLSVFEHPDVKKTLAKRGIKVASPPKR